MGWPDRATARPAVHSLANIGRRSARGPLIPMGFLTSFRQTEPMIVFVSFLQALPRNRRLGRPTHHLPFKCGGRGARIVCSPPCRQRISHASKNSFLLNPTNLCTRSTGRRLVLD